LSEMKRRRLEREWVLTYATHREDTVKAYKETVAKGNTQTYSEFVESIRKDWIEEMMKG